VLEKRGKVLPVFGSVYSADIILGFVFEEAVLFLFVDFNLVAYINRKKGHDHIILQAVMDSHFTSYRNVSRDGNIRSSIDFELAGPRPTDNFARDGFSSS
jgi:hypothetical protein